VATVDTAWMGASLRGHAGTSGSDNQPTSVARQLQAPTQCTQGTFCTHNNAVMKVQDCDGDGVLDISCAQDGPSGHMSGYLSIQNKCVSNWPHTECRLPEARPDGGQETGGKVYVAAPSASAPAPARTGDATADALLHGGEDCFYECMKASGPCLFCGRGNLCCSANSEDNDENTRDVCKAAGPYAHGGSFHECVAAGGAEAATAGAFAATMAVDSNGANGTLASTTGAATTSSGSLVTVGPSSTSSLLTPAQPVLSVQTAAPVVTTTTEASSSSSGSSSGGTAFWILFALLLLCCCLAACAAVAVFVKGQSDKKNKKRAADHEIEYRPTPLPELPPLEETSPTVVEERIVERAPEPVVEELPPVPPVEVPFVAEVPVVTAVPTNEVFTWPMAPAVQPMAYTQPIFGPMPTFSTQAMMQQQPMSVFGPLASYSMPAVMQPMMPPTMSQPFMGDGMYQFR